MDELITAVSERAGISEAQAQKAIDVVLEQVKEKLPAPIAAQVDSLIAGNGGADMQEITKGLGKLFG